MKYYLLFALVFLTAGCQLQEDDEMSAIDKAVSNWAECFFNFDYKGALEYTTPESGKWIRFAASNITQSDIDFIQEHDNKVSINVVDHYLTAGDTASTARIRASDFVRLDLIDHNNTVVDQAEFQLNLVKRKGEWMVDLKGLPQK